MNKEQMIFKMMEMLIGTDTKEVAVCDSVSLANNYVGQYCIIRTYSAGVHFGKVTQAQGKEVVLSESRRIWSWSDRFTLSKIAVDGLETGKLSCPVDDLYLSEGIEIIPVSKEAKESLYEIKEHSS